jgi:PIN domain nuclease of toxin-antitoxin system
VADGSSKLGRLAAEAYLDPENQRFLSAASAWEIMLKYAKGRMPLPRNPEVYVPWLRELVGATELPVREEAALHVRRLPWLHQDPFDRLLIAQAIVHDMTILTPDEAIGQYGVKTLW